MISTGRTWRDIAARCGLSPNELTAAQYRSLGYETATISERIGCAPRTVHVHLAAARRKCEARKDSELARWLVQRGLHPLQAWPRVLLLREGLVITPERPSEIPQQEAA